MDIIQKGFSNGGKAAGFADGKQAARFQPRPQKRNTADILAELIRAYRPDENGSDGPAGGPAQRHITGRTDGPDMWRKSCILTDFQDFLLKAAGNGQRHIFQSRERHCIQMRRQPWTFFVKGHHQPFVNGMADGK